MDQESILFSSLPPTPRQKQIAAAIVIALLAGCVAVAPFLSVQLPAVPSFIPIVDTVLFIADALTAALLLAQCSIARSRALLALACGYLFTAVIIVPHALTFPGVFSAKGLLSADLQTTVWLYIFWHLGLPPAVLAYTLLRDRDSVAPMKPRIVRRAMVGAACTTAAFAGGLTWLTTAGARWLPIVMVDYRSANVRWHYLALLVIGPSVAAVGLLFRRRRSALDLWLLVALSGWLIESVLLATTVARYALVWYAGRIYGVISTNVVLFVLLWHTTLLYARLGNVLRAEQRERENRMLTLDAVSASFAHEIKQPLSAMVANAGAALRWLQRTVPNIDEAVDALRTIVSDGMRTSDAISSIRTLVRHDRAINVDVDVAALLNDSLTALHGELSSHAITTETNFNGALPSVHASKPQLQQVFVNLIVNAIEAMASIQSRPRLLQVSAHSADGEVVVAISDSGPGIAAESQTRIFGAFYSTKPSGTGLGLAICKSIVESHHGRLWTSPNGLHGSTFHVALPASSHASPATAPLLR
jgi:signal transduction histidine kinase